MDFFSIPLFQTAKTRLQFLETRQNALSENIAHADVPKYHAKDVTESEFQKLIEHGSSLSMTVPLETTNTRHIAGTLANAQSPFKVQDVPDREMSPNGNTVVLEDQMMKMNETQVSHQLATSIYRKAVELLRLAIHNA